MIVGKLPVDSVLVFAGSGDIDSENMEVLLEEHLPEALSYPPVIEADIAEDYTGLLQVSGWLDSQFGKADVERVPSALKYIRDLDTAEKIFLIVLWGNGGDAATEKLIDTASRKNVPVLDLADGLDEVQFDNSTASASRIPGSKHTRRATAKTPAAEAVPETSGSDGPPWDTGSEIADNTELQLTELLAVACEGAARALRAQLRATRKSHLAPVPALPVQADSRLADDTAESTPSSAPRSSRKPAAPPGTRAWLQNPDNPDQYEFKGRGRPRDEMRNWNIVYLTSQDEKKFGLKIPDRARS